MKNKVPPKVWVISEVFYPDEASTAYIMTQIARDLAVDAEVHVICGPSGYGEIKALNMDLSMLHLHRVKLFNLDKNRLLQRLLRLLILSFSMFFIALFNISRKDKVFLVTNPAFALPLFSLLKKLKRFRYFVLVHDVFPENLIPAGVIGSKNNFMYKLLKSVFDWSYAKADKLFVLGRDMAAVLDDKIGQKSSISIIENWAQLDEIHPEDYQSNQLVLEKKLSDKIVLLFAGNLGRLQALEYYFDCIKLVTNPKVHFAFVGDGAMLSDLKRLSEENNFRNVSFWGTFPRNYQNVFLNASHFGVITLDQNLYGLGVPSKTYNIMAAAKPIIFLGNQSSEVAKLIEEANCGITFNWGNSSDFVAFLNRLDDDTVEKYSIIGLNGRHTAESKYSKDIILGKFKYEILKYA